MTGVFEALAMAGNNSAPREAKAALERAVDTAVFRSRERFGAYLANSRTKEDFAERWAEVKPHVIRIINEAGTTPTPGVIRRVGAALRPVTRPAPVKTAKAPAEDSIVRVGATQKQAWSYDQTTKLYKHTGAFEAFSCPGCGSKQNHLGFNKCAGCNRTFNSWIVRGASSSKTGSANDILMCREIKMRGDQFRLAADDSDSDSGNPFAKKDDDDKDDKDDDDSDDSDDSDDDDDGDSDDDKSDDDNKKESSVKKKADDAPPMGMTQPNVGTMPGDNSGAVGAPVAPMGGPAGADGDVDVPGTEGSPLDQIQDALTDAVFALKDVQMLAVGNPMSATASNKKAKIARLRASMDRFWNLHEQMVYVAGQLAKEAKEAIRQVDPRRNDEQEFVNGYYAAKRNAPLPDNAGKPFLEGYVAFHKQADSYSTDGDISGDFVNQPDGESTAVQGPGKFLDSTQVDAPDKRGDAGLNGDAGSPSEAPFIDRAQGIDGGGVQSGDASTMKFQGAVRGREVSSGPKATTTPNKRPTRRAG